MRPALAALAAVSLIALAAPAFAITGGAPAAPSGQRHEVMIVGSHGSFCTGIALARDLVLTAAHCVAPGSDYKLIEFDAARRPRLLDVQAVARHPQFKPQALFAHRATADVAILKMAHPLPDEISPLRLGAGPVPRIGDTLTVVGYGLAVAGDGKTGGTLRVARLAVTGKPGSLQIRLVDPATRNARPGLGACTGDSGAPAFDHDGRLVGVVSWTTAAGNGTGCGGLTGLTPLVSYKEWIEREAAKLGSAPP
jgi:S1-C subfamily serine protease